MKGKAGLRHVKRDDMIETGGGCGHDESVHPGVPGLYATVQGLSTVRMARRKRRGPKIVHDRKDLSRIRPRAA